MGIFLHPCGPFTWEVKHEWDEMFQSLNKGEDLKVDFYSIRSLAHALDNIAFLINRRYIPYDKIMPEMMENHFRIANILLGDYIRYNLNEMEAGGLLFPIPPDYKPSFGQNFLQLINKINNQGELRSPSAKVWHILKLHRESLEEKLDMLNKQPSLEERVCALERLIQNPTSRPWA